MPDEYATLTGIRTIVLQWPEAEEYTCHSTPAFRVRKKLLARLREDGITLAVHSDDRDPWIERNSQTFFVTDHYRNASFVLVNLETVTKQELIEVLFEAWREIAPQRALKLYEEKNR